jgi:hypothetical protein
MSKIYATIYFIWVAISLDIVAIATQLHYIITMFLWLRHKDKMFFASTDDYRTSRDRKVATTALAIAGIEL